MATYNVIDLMKILSELIYDGHYMADIDEIPADEDFPASLSFSIQDEGFEIDFGEVDSSEHFEKIQIPTDVPFYPFSIEELLLIKQSVDNALEYYKSCMDDPSYSPDIKADIRSSSVKARNFQAKLSHILPSK